MFQIVLLLGAAAVYAFSPQRGDILLVNVVLTFLLAFLCFSVTIGIGLLLRSPPPRTFPEARRFGLLIGCGCAALSPFGTTAAAAALTIHPLHWKLPCSPATIAA